MMISFRKETVEATPGKDCITFEISLLPPGFLSISEEPIVRRETGLSSVLLNGDAVTSTTFKLSVFSSSPIFKTVGVKLFTCISKIVFLLNPTKEAVILYKPGLRFFNSYFPSISVAADVVLLIPTKANGIGSLLMELYTLPLIIPF